MKRFFAIAFAAIITSLFVLSGCNARSAGSHLNENYAEAPSKVSSNYGGTSKSDQEYSEGKEENESPFELALDPSLKIVWTGNVSMETTAWAETLSGLKTLFAAHNVQIISAEETGGNRFETNGKIRTSARNAVYVLRVPSENFGDFIDGFGDVPGSVTSSSKSREDKTKQYDSNKLSLELLETEYEDLKKLLSEAKSLDEIMTVRDRMTEVMREIRSLSETNNHIDYDVQYSRVTYTLREVVVYSDPEKTESWGVRFGKSFVEGAGNFGAFVGDVVIWFGENLFFLILFAVLFVILPIVIIRSAIRKARKKRTAAPEQADPSKEGKKE